MSETIEPWLNLLPSLKGIEAYIENKDWASNKTKHNMIQLLNRNFSYTIDVKKPNVLVRFFIR